MASPENMDVLPAAGLIAAKDARLQGHMPALDGLRGMAILGVMASHFINLPHTPGQSAIDHYAGIPFSLGWLGVDLFFVLSGFLITGILFDSKESSHYFRNFYARRTLRIFPLFYLFLLIRGVVLPHLTSLPSMGHQWPYWFYLFSIDRAFHVYPITALTVTWSLDIEEQFYLVWPLILFLCSRKTAIRICVSMIAVTLLLRFIAAATVSDVRIIYWVTPFRLDGLALGSLIALVMRGRGGIPWLVSKARILAPLFAIGLIASLASILHRNAIVWTDRWVGLTVVLFFSAMTFGCCLIWAVVKQPAFLSLSFFRFFGRYSYSLYLFHNTAKDCVDRVINPAKLPLILGARFPAMLGYALICTAVSVCVALITWNGFEKHFLKLKKHFPEKKRPIASDPVLLAVPMPA